MLMRTWTILALTALLLALPAGGSTAELAQAQQHLDEGRPDEALALLDRLLKNGKPSADVLLMRSTGRIMAGNLKGGFQDLERALAIDPTLRQGWLNLAGLEIAEGNYAKAYEALVKAQKLDPQASDSYLNLGAVLLMQGELERAKGRFERYLELERGSAEGFYLVASNYALAGRQRAAVDSLGRAIALDERMRMRARTDQRFLALESFDYQRLLATDSFVPPADHHAVAAAFPVPYDQRDNRLLYAVLDAMAQLREPYDAGVEATAAWALIWGEMRIKVYNQTNGTGVVSLSASPGRLTSEAWHRRSQALFRAVHEALGE